MHYITHGVYPRIAGEFHQIVFRDSLSFGPSVKCPEEHVKQREVFHNAVYLRTRVEYTPGSIRDAYNSVAVALSSIDARDTLVVISPLTLDGALFECCLAHLAISGWVRCDNIMFMQCHDPLSAKSLDECVHRDVSKVLLAECWDAFCNAALQEFIGCLRSLYGAASIPEDAFAALLPSSVEFPGLSPLDRLILGLLSPPAVLVKDLYCVFSNNPWDFGPEYLYHRLLKWISTPLLAEIADLKDVDGRGRLGGCIALKSSALDNRAILNNSPSMEFGGFQFGSEAL